MAKITRQQYQDEVKKYWSERCNKLQKQSDLLALGLMQEKNRVQKLEKALDYAKKFIDGHGNARIKENLGRDGMDAVLEEIDKIVEPTDTCPICGDEKPVSDLHRNCGK